MSLSSLGVNFKQYAMVAAGSLGLTGGRAPSGPLEAQVGISDPCNHRCVFCWDHPPAERENDDTAQRFGYAKPGVMSLDRFKGIVDDLYKLGTRRIDLIGRGEPLANRSAVEMIRYVKGRGMQLMMVTNGSRLFEPVAQAIVDARVDRVNISLNAGTPETYPHIHVTESPENFRRVVGHIRALSDMKKAADTPLPYLNLSFVITSKNYFEIDRMVEVAHEVGAQDAQFIHTVVHEGTQDLALSEDQFRHLQASLPAIVEKAAALKVESNLVSFGLEIPPYMPSEMVGPSVVPCYAGWYFAVVLGNGSVMPCCQCAKPIGQVTDKSSFADIWASDDYAAFRKAARSLPEKSDKLSKCECDNCQLRPRNLALHNFLHPINPITAGPEVKSFKPRDFVRRMRGHHGEPVA